MQFVIKVYSLNPPAPNDPVKTIMSCIVIVQGSEVEEYPVLKSCQGEFHFLELMERVNSLLGNAVLPFESQWCECEVGDSGFLQQ